MTETNQNTSFLKVTQNALLLILYHLINGFTQFLFFLFIIRIIPKSHMDIFELGRSCLEIGVGIIGSSISTVIIRENARNFDWWYDNINQIKRITIYSSLILGLSIYFTIVIQSPTLLHTVVIALFCIAILFQSKTDVLEAHFRSKDRIEFPVIIGLASNIFVLTVTIFFIIFSSYPIVWASIGVLTRWLLQGLLLSTKIPKKTKINTLRRDLFQKNLFKDVLPISIGLIAFIIYARIDVLMLKWMGFEHTIATYSCAFRPIGFITMFVAAFYQSFAPSISRMIHNDSTNALKITIKTGFFFSIIGLFLSFFLIHFSDQITALIYPEAFKQSSSGIRVLAWSFPIIFGGNAVGYYLVNFGKNAVKYYMTINIFGLIFNIIGNFILIPKFNFIGAAWTTIITDAITTTLMLLSCIWINYRAPSIKQ